jgi:hypothetical protein
MSRSLNGLVAVAGWSALVLLSLGPGPLPAVARIVALALLVGCLASLVIAVGWFTLLRGLLPEAHSHTRSARVRRARRWSLRLRRRSHVFDRPAPQTFGQRHPPGPTF